LVLTRKTAVVIVVMPIVGGMSRYTSLDEEQQTKCGIKHVQTRSGKHIYTLLNKCSY
jgi:hypothetical protein